MLFRLVSVCVFSVLAAAATQAYPALAYSTYLRDNFTATAIATDSSGNIYLTGNVVVDPATTQTTVLVLKLNPQATEYVYTRFLGGSENENARAIAVDGAGSVYVAGVTSSPDFPVTNDSNLGTTPANPSERSFVTKLDPSGDLVYSTLLGGSTNSFAQAVAVNAAGQVLVSGTSESPGFPTTAGAYSVSNTQSMPYVLELDSTLSKLVFSAVGIGGSSITFDPSGNIYMAGTTNSLTYPTTPGTYQPKFPVFQTCIAPCGGRFQGYNQYVTKLDPSGTKIIFSTAVSGTGNTTNNGLAVDAEGNVYVTGLAGQGYPYTVTPPAIPLGPALAVLAFPALPYLSKLDPAGQKLLYSVPVGGVGVQVGSQGNAYVGGVLGLFSGYDVAAALPALEKVPAGCLLPVMTEGSFAGSAYAAQVDSSGNLLGSQFIGGTSLRISGVALRGNSLWLTGAVSIPNFPFTPNALMSPNLLPNQPAGGYLGAVNFSAERPPAGAPLIGCIVDAADLAPTGPLAPNQLLTIFGDGLGPSTPVTAGNDSTTMLGGVNVSFGSLPAPLLYVSANQINVAVPLIREPTATVQVTVNAVSSAPLEFPIISKNPSLFSVSGSFQGNLQESVTVALNGDGSVNSASNPAQLGSAITVFVNGLSANPQTQFSPPQLSTDNGWSLTKVSQAGPFVVQLELKVPAANRNFYCAQPTASVCLASFAVTDATPYLLPGSQPQTAPGPAFSGVVYVKQ